MPFDAVAERKGFFVSSRDSAVAYAAIDLLVDFGLFGVTVDIRNGLTYERVEGSARPFGVGTVDVGEAKVPILEDDRRRGIVEIGFGAPGAADGLLFREDQLGHIPRGAAVAEERSIGGDNRSPIGN